MATLTTFTAGDTIRSADVNANFQALNTDLVAAQADILASMTPLYTTSTPVSTVAATETTLASFTLAANAIPANGGGLLVRALGLFENVANAKTLKFYVGSASSQLNLTAAPQSKTFYVDLWLTRVTSTGYYIAGMVTLSALDGASSPTLEAAGRFSVVGSPNFAIAQTVKITGQVTTGAGGEMSLQTFSVWSFGT